MEIEISSNQKRWAKPDANRVSVTIAVSATGLGFGKGRWEPVTLAGAEYYCGWWYQIAPSVPGDI